MKRPSFFGSTKSSKHTDVSQGVFHLVHSFINVLFYFTIIDDFKIQRANLLQKKLPPMHWCTNIATQLKLARPLKAVFLILTVLRFTLHCDGKINAHAKYKKPQERIKISEILLEFILLFKNPKKSASSLLNLFYILGNTYHISLCLYLNFKGFF